MLSPRKEVDFSSYSNAIHSDVLLPTVDHSRFRQDPTSQKALLTLLYNKLAVERRSSDSNLFLQFDRDVSWIYYCYYYYDHHHHHHHNTTTKDLYRCPLQISSLLC